MFKDFIKYQSLGNDFIVFDLYRKPLIHIKAKLNDSSWSNFVIQVCNRHHGVGADGVLIITHSSQIDIPEMLIFNADDRQAETCLNGLRCVAQHLFIRYHFPKEFKIKSDQRLIECCVGNAGKNDADNFVTMCIGDIQIQGELSVETPVGTFQGSKVLVGNPHFIVFEKISFDWLRQHGHYIETSPLFPQRTNVEFVQEETVKQNNGIFDKVYDFLVYERGCGVTLACSSGATAVIGLLFHQKQITMNQKIGIKMPGGILTAWINQGSKVVLRAKASFVFSGSTENSVEKSFDKTVSNFL